MLEKLRAKSGETRGAGDVGADACPSSTPPLPRGGKPSDNEIDAQQPRADPGKHARALSGGLVTFGDEVFTLLQIAGDGEPSFLVT